MIRLPSLCIRVLACCAVVGAVHAADEPSETELRQRIERAVDMADRATQQGGGPRVNAEKIPVPLSVPLPVPLPAVPLADPAATARRLESVVGRPAVPSGPMLYAFVSLSMPRASLQRLLADAQTHGATLVMRGLVNRSLKETTTAAQALMGERKIGWLIDPQAFQRFGVVSVPSYVLVRSHAMPEPCALRECFAEADYVRLAGDVTLRYALTKIGEFEPRFGHDVALLMQRGGGQ
jgi:conjugal transfer pilus assembly protein TrbC